MSVCLFVIHLSSLVKCLVISFAHFLFGLFVFLLWSFDSSLYIQDTSPLAHMLFADIISQPVACLLTFFIGSFFSRAKVFSFY